MIIGNEPIYRFIDALKECGREVKSVKPDQWLALCPAHDDHDPSLAIKKGDAGRVIVKCHAGCSTEAVVDALGLTMADLFPRDEKTTSQDRPSDEINASAMPEHQQIKGSLDSILASLEKKTHSRCSKQWIYHDKSKREVMRVLRFDSSQGKTFRPIHATMGGWTTGKPSGQLPLYGLPDLANAKRVYVCEGEKATDAARSIGLIATTSAHGSQSPSKTDWTPLAGCDVVILPDNDKPGRVYAEMVASILHALKPRATVRIVDLPDLPSKGDIVEWMEQHDAVEADGLQAMIEELVNTTRPIDPLSIVGELKTICMADVEQRPIEWLWHKRIPQGKMTILAGDPGLGKTFVTMDIAARISAGLPWPDEPDELIPCGGVILLSAEDDPEDTLAPRLQAAGADLNNIRLIQGKKLDNGSDASFSFDRDIPELEKLLAECGNIRLVVVDPITAYLGKTDSHKNADVRGLLTPLTDLANRYRVAILAVNHLNKSSGSNAQHRMSGSVAFVAAARAGWLIAKDKNDPQRRIMAPAKMNLGPDSTSLAYCLEDSDIRGIARVVWEKEPLQLTADDLLADENKTQSDHGERDEASEWLREILSSGAVLAVKIQKLAKDNGFSWVTVKRAKKYIGAYSKREGFGSGSKSYWVLNDRTGSSNTIESHVQDVSQYAKGESV